MSSQRPTVFVGSSTEALPILRRVVRLLKPVADVTRWDEGSKYKKPGEYLLDSLIRASSRFDFAILIFSPDDVVRSRGNTQRAPRDNVIFELGLFMSRLNRERAFVVAPKLIGLKILSDMHGLNVLEYDVVAREGKTRKVSLGDVCRDIAEKMREPRPRRDLHRPSGVTDLHRPLEDLIRLAHSHDRTAVISNIALDMEVTWPLVRDMILASRQVEDVAWRSLMIDHRSPEIGELSGDTASVVEAENNERQVVEYCRRHAPELARRKIVFECRAYREVPTLHGFLCNDTALIFSLCGVEGGRLVGAPNAYLRLDRGDPDRDDEAEHFIRAFGGWFEHRWREGRRVWPDGEDSL